MKNTMSAIRLIAIAERCIKMMYSLSFTTAGEREARRAALEALDLARAEVITVGARAERLQQELYEADALLEAPSSPTKHCGGAQAGKGEEGEIE